MKTSYWICVNPKGQMTDLSTAKWLRKESINALLAGSVYTWKECQAFGWICIKQTIEI